MGLIEFVASKLKCFYFHWISNEFLCSLDFDDGIVASHIGKNVGEIGIFFDILKHSVNAVLCVEDGWIEFGGIARN